MGKIKLNLVSGAVVEKPLINAFKANENTYVVFDNEMNGSMGLPIILVCKLANEKLVKITDQGEWQVVKEYLKNIIAGNPVEYIAISENLVADDIYYTQLTLPVPSFDALKSSYKVENNSADTNVADLLGLNNQVIENVIEPSPLVNSEPTNVEIPVVPQQEPVINVEQPVVEPVVEEQDNTSINLEQPTIEPVIDFNSIMPTMDNAPSMDNIPSVDVTKTVMANDVVVEQSETDNKFKDQKEAFMQACENMFDALVQKFEKELEKK